MLIFRVKLKRKHIIIKFNKQKNVKAHTARYQNQYSQGLVVENFNINYILDAILNKLPSCYTAARVQADFKLSISYKLINTGLCVEMSVLVSFRLINEDHCLWIDSVGASEEHMNTAYVHVLWMRKRLPADLLPQHNEFHTSCLKWQVESRCRGLRKHCLFTNVAWGHFSGVTFVLAKSVFCAQKLCSLNVFFCTQSHHLLTLEWGTNVELYILVLRQIMKMEGKP